VQREHSKRWLMNCLSTILFAKIILLFQPFPKLLAGKQIRNDK
jgi:hypothetical protein